jgi:hypothetical protein
MVDKKNSNSTVFSRDCILLPIYLWTFRNNQRWSYGL